jgi:hypothetical protein
MLSQAKILKPHLHSSSSSELPLNEICAVLFLKKLNTSEILHLRAWSLHDSIYKPMHVSPLHMFFSVHLVRF